ncbi:hypothetical protein BX616_005622 [Lobosporangium transversale]|nr:hypothetical protein BX616_005622 [Lobosporangium transversale]
MDDDIASSLFFTYNILCELNYNGVSSSLAIHVESEDTLEGLCDLLDFYGLLKPIEESWNVQFDRKCFSYAWVSPLSDQMYLYERLLSSDVFGDMFLWDRTVPKGKLIIFANTHADRLFDEG